jgi:ATP-dependent DNA helicase RecG
MARHHCQHLQHDIDQYLKSMGEEDVLEKSNPKSVQLTERQKKILKLFVITGEINVLEDVLENVLETSSSLASKLGVDARTIRRDLSTLQTLGYLRHVGPDKGGRWQILQTL